MGKVYRHFKGGDYKIITHATIENSGDEVVVYQALYGDKKCWVRPAKEFYEKVVIDGKSVERFAELKSHYNALDLIRKKYPNAYKPWSQEDDAMLEQLYCEGKTTKELKVIFRRRQGAIESRVEKLELQEKYK